MPTLNQLLPCKEKHTANLFPVTLTWEERRQMFNCPIYNYSVSVYSCWQCPHAETHSQSVSDLTKRSCHCVWPNKASKPSRKLTSLMALKISGVAEAEATVESRRAAKAEKLKKAREAKPKREGQAVKLEYLKTLVQQSLTKEQIKEKMIEKYSTMSDGYFSALLYHAVKETGKIVASSAPSKKKEKGGMQEKIETMKGLFTKGFTKASVVMKMVKLYPSMSEAYASTLFYTTARQLGVVLPKVPRKRKEGKD